MKRVLFSLGICAALVAGCGDRGSQWDAEIDSSNEALGLQGSVALIDAPTERVMMIAANADLSPVYAPLPLGRGYVRAETTQKRDRLLVLSQGDVPRRSLEDQGPSLTVYDGSSSPKVSETYPLLNPLKGLQVDPDGEYAVVHAVSDDTAFVLNPNELIITNITKQPSSSNPRSVTLRSFGGAPSSFVFTPSLGIPGGARRMLIALTDRDLGLVDLDDASSSDITVPLSDSDERLAPSGVAVSDGDPDVADDALIAIQLAASNDVVILRFQTPSTGSTSAHPFQVVPNKVPVGGVASAIGFVHTDGGLRLAALVPGRQSIALVDPDRGLSTEVPLGATFDQMRIMPSPDGDGDLAIVWSSYSAVLGLVSLGSSIGKPYRSVDTISLSSYVEELHDVPNVDSQKLLRLSNGSQFVVLDLVARTAAPLISTSGAEVSLSPDGQRAVIFVPGSASLRVWWI
ncbi:MAG: hypothetical protein U0165_02465 [Polyangiaceae bacterium]